jgi:hypothetical protein
MMKDKLIALYRYTYRVSPAVQVQKKMFWLSFFLGIFGIHRYMMGYKFWWLMLITMGGLGIWSLWDIWRLYTGQLVMANGSPLLDHE